MATLTQNLSIDAAGWLADVNRIDSPNFAERPAGTTPSLLVIHNISLPPGQFGGPYVAEFFCNRLDCDAHPFFKEIEGMTVSAHLLIDRDGEITQFVSFADCAWHAGVSVFEGRERCNEYSIGVELEGVDALPYTSFQYAALTRVTQQIMLRYPDITRERIVGHSDIAPGRKTDPGPAFGWQRYLSGL